MKTAIDTNVFSRIFLGGDEARQAERALWRCSEDGVLVICPVVYSEMLANPMLTEQHTNALLEEVGAVVDFAILPKVWTLAGLRFGAYARRRRTSGGGESRRLVADFVVGSHALLQAQRLLTFDSRRYTTDFPELKMAHISGT